MIKTLYYSLKLDTYYAINSLIYTLRKLPIFSDLLTDKAYKSKGLKVISAFIGIILSLLRMVAYRLVYFGVIYSISKFISKDSNSFYHIFFVFTIIGMFINNKLLNSSLKKYLSVTLFKIDAKNYLKYSLFYNLFMNLLLNTLGFYVFGLDMLKGFILVLFGLCVRVVGEGLNIWYFRKYGKFWYENYFVYFSLLGILLVCSFLPYFGIIVDNRIIYFSFVGALVLAISSYTYINSYNEYGIIFKRINTLNNALSSTNDRDVLVDIRDKDIKIDPRKLEGKTGYEYFNTIFFERHKSILYRSSRNISVILIVLYLVASYFIFDDLKVADAIGGLLVNRLGLFVFIMYFINRGSSVTRAMFYNCDHAMLQYNFYRDPKVIVGLFRKRLKTIIKVNLIPALVIGFGNLFLMYLTLDNWLINGLFMFLFIILLSILYSMHYLVLYYLLQPYNKDMKVKRVGFSIASLLTYLVTLSVSDVVVSSMIFSLCGLIFCIIYIVIANKLIENKAMLTFKIN